MESWSHGCLLQGLEVSTRRRFPEPEPWVAHLFAIEFTIVKNPIVKRCPIQNLHPSNVAFPLRTTCVICTAALSDFGRAAFQTSSNQRKTTPYRVCLRPSTNWNADAARYCTWDCCIEQANVELSATATLPEIGRAHV